MIGQCPTQIWYSSVHSFLRENNSIILPNPIPEKNGLENKYSEPQ